MKKILILAIMLACYSNIFAFLTQSNWRWRNDDGTETTATWKAAQNAQTIMNAPDEVWRLRLNVYNSTPNDTLSLLDTLQYSTSTGGPWINIDMTTTSNPFIIAGTSSYVVQAEPTTAQLTDASGYSFATGKTMVDSVSLQNYALIPSQRTEFEWTIKSTSALVPNTIYYFRQWGITQSLDPSNTYPSLVTAGLLPIKMSGFTALRENKNVKLQWTTSSEQNNTRFEIQRSSDGRTWTTITSINGNGTGAASTTYKAYDQNPLSGVSYYVIKQFNADGHSYLSDIKLVKMPEIKGIILVTPNPSHSGISFRISNISASNVDASVINMNGLLVHREIINSIQPNSINKLSMKEQLSPGVYILRLKSETLSQSTQLVIE
jgi:Secretion system C-terminal sorting domain